MYAGSNDNRVYALTRDGTLRWVVETDSTVAPVAVGPETVYASSNRRLYAFARD